MRLGDLKNALAAERATRPMASDVRAGSYCLRRLLPGVAGDKIEKVQVDELLAKAPAVAPQNDVAGVLRDRVQDVMAVADKSPDLAFSMAASVCRRWKRAEESEYIFSEMMKVCERLAGGRDLEVTVTVFRSFAHRLSSKEIHRRARLRIGRLYYEHGHFGKAVVELDVDKDIKNPNRYDSLACLVRAVSLIRLGKSEEGMSLLKWVASYSPEEQQQARAAYLIGRLNLLYGRNDEAARWLKKCANELTVQRYAVYARRLLRRLNQ